MGGINDVAAARFQPPGTYTGAENTSKFKLEAGIQGYLEVISGQYGGLYHGIRSSAMGNKIYGPYVNDQSAWGECHEVDVEMFGRLKGIEWGHIADPATRLAAIAKFAKGDLGTEIMGIAGKIASAWPDKSGAFAAEKLKQLADVCGKYGDSANVFAAALGAPGGGLHDSTLAKINALMDFCNKTSAGFINHMHTQNIGELADRLGAVDICLRMQQDLGREPFNLDNMRDDGHVINQVGWGNKWYSNIEINRLTGFADPYRDSIVAFRGLIRDVYNAVNQQMGSLVQVQPDGSGAPFDALKSDPPKPDPAPTTTSTGGSGGGSGGGYTGGSGGGGTIAANSGYVPPPTSAYTPAISTTPDISPTATPDLPAAPDLTSASSVAPVTEPETVTIKDGDRQIAVQSPDGQGHVKISIDDGSGKPKTYDMDFGDWPTQARGGAAGVRQDADPADPAEPTAATGDRQPEDGAEPAKAGADGKVVVHDGDLTITAERPDGMPDQLKVTVDDGSGHPTTYNVDYQDGSGDPAQPGTADAKQPDAPATHHSAGGTGHGGAFTGSGTGTDPGLTAPTHQDFAQPAHSGAAAVAADTTTPQATATPLTAGGPPGSASLAGDHGPHSGADDHGIVHPAGPGDAQLAAAPDGSTPDTAAGQQGGMAGMPMMGGMGGGGGGGGGDGQRGGGSGWRTTGNLFDDEFGAAGRPEGIEDFEEEPQW